MLDVADAQRLVLSHARPLPTVELPLRDALHRTLAAPVLCDLDDPPFDKAMMDGYALRAADVATVPRTLKVVGQIAAGATPNATVGPGEAMQINTGAPIPSGADAVARVENTSLSGDRVTIQESASAGKFITSRGDYARAGKIVLESGTHLTPVHVGVVATAGAARVTVYRQPTVAVLATGDELVDIDRRPTAAQIRNSNQYLLEALIRSAHAEPRILGVCGDDRAVLRSKITDGLLSDVLCITGGVSAGAFDFVPDILKELGASFHVHKLAIKPGRPTIFATVPNGVLVFALPGNPISAFIGFELLVRPALAALQGRSASLPELFLARLEGTLPATASRRSYHPAFASVAADGQWTARTLSWRGSGDSMGMAGANAMIMRPPNSTAVGDGDRVSLFLLDRVM